MNLKKAIIFKGSIAYSCIATLLSIFIFIFISLWTQISQILYLELSILDKYKSMIYVIKDSFTAMGLFAFILFIIWTFSLFMFYISFFSLIIAKNRNKKSIKSNSTSSLELMQKNNIKNGILGIFSFIFSFISFGCVACGQAILFSIITLFVTSITLTLAHTIANIILVLAIVFLLYASYKNFKLLQNPSICPIG